MTAVRFVAIGLGIVFGFVLAWAGMTNPDLIRAMLLLDDAYFYLVMFSSMAVAFTGIRLLRRRGARAILTGEPLAWNGGRPERRHVHGSVLFGIGWATTLSCPGPIAAQLGQGRLWSLCTIAGICVGLVAQAQWQVRRSPKAEVLA